MYVPLRDVMSASISLYLCYCSIIFLDSRSESASVGEPSGLLILKFLAVVSKTHTNFWGSRIDRHCQLFSKQMSFPCYKTISRYISWHIHVIIIIKSEVSTFPIVTIFFHGCVPEMFVTSYSVTYCIYVLGKPGICFHYYCTVYDECKQSDAFWLSDRIRLLVQYTISLSSLCKLIWRHWTYKMPVRCILSNVWVRLSIFSQLSIIQYAEATRVCLKVQ